MPLSNSTTIDRDVTRENDPSALPSTKSRTRVAEVRRASNSASTSFFVANSTPSCSLASSRRSANQT
jgi:hypothetical protein